MQQPFYFFSLLIPGELHEQWIELKSTWTCEHLSMWYPYHCNLFLYSSSSKHLISCIHLCYFFFLLLVNFWRQFQRRFNQSHTTLTWWSGEEEGKKGGQSVNPSTHSEQSSHFRAEGDFGSSEALWFIWSKFIIPVMDNLKQHCVVFICPATFNFLPSICPGQEESLEMLAVSIISSTT